MKIYLIRHGESIGNAKGIHQGQKNDFPLSELGKEQTNSLKKRFKNLKIDAIYSSDLKRAKETAEFLSKSTNLNIITDKRLRERDFGLIGEEKDIMKAWNHHIKKQTKEKGISSREVTPLNGESDKDHFDRVKSFFEDLKKNHRDEEKIIIIAHGGTNKVAFGVIKHLPLNKMYKTPQGNTCVNEFAFNKNKWEVKSINCMKHIETNKEVITNFEKIRDEPLDMIKNRCWEKHIKLRKIFNSLGYKTKYKICSFNWSEQNLPKEIINLPHSNLDYHLYLMIKTNGLKLIVDASNDSLLPFYNNWNGKTNCDLCVVPKKFIEENLEEIIRRKTKEKNSKDQLAFLNKVNSFLEELRKTNRPIH